VQFSGQEGYGRYVDLYMFHSRALNLKQFGQSDYLNFLRIFYKFERVDKKDKNTEYKECARSIASNPLLMLSSFSLPGSCRTSVRICSTFCCEHSPCWT
jgi:hypothetical protein